MRVLHFGHFEVAAVLQPVIDLRLIGIHGPELLVNVAVNGQAFALFPPTDGADVALQVVRDRFPGVEPGLHSRSGPIAGGHRGRVHRIPPERTDGVTLVPFFTIRKSWMRELKGRDGELQFSRRASHARTRSPQCPRLRVFTGCHGRLAVIPSWIIAWGKSVLFRSSPRCRRQPHA